LIKKIPDLFKFFTCVETTYLNKDMCKFEPSQKDESRASPLIPRQLAAN